MKVLKVPTYSELSSVFSNKFETVEVPDNYFETLNKKEEITTLASSPYSRGIKSARALVEELIIKCPNCKHIAKTEEEAEYILDNFCAVCEDAKASYAEEMKTMEFELGEDL